MSLLDHAIWWHVYPLGACGAPIRPPSTAPETTPVPRLRRLEAWLDYAVELGCSGLLLGPVFASTSHGYDTIDYFRLDPRLGTEEDWRRFADAAHERGLLLMLDGVFNHVGAHHQLVEAARRGEGMVHLDGDAHRGWEGHGDLAELDHGDPRVVELVTEVMRYWLDRGADAWRLDVAYAVPGEFWTEVLGGVRSTHPGAVFLGEVIHGDFPAIAADGGLDAVTAYELWKAVWSSLVDRNMWELAWAMERHEEMGSRMGADRILQTFVGNHDVTRIASRTGNDGAAVAAAILLTVPGMPSIYYGDEQAFRGVKGEGARADDDIRPALPDSPAGLAPDGWWLYHLHQELIALRRRHPWITRGHLSVVDKTNPTISYRVSGDGHVLDASIDLNAGPSVRISIDGDTALTLPR